MRYHLWSPNLAGRYGVALGEPVELPEALGQEFAERGIASPEGKSLEVATAKSNPKAAKGQKDKP